LLCAAILIFSLSGNFALLLFLTVFIGYGVALGQVALLGYIAQRYHASALSWVQACFSLGGMIAPFFVSYAISAHGTWRFGYHDVFSRGRSTPAFFTKRRPSSARNIRRALSACKTPRRTSARSSSRCWSASSAGVSVLNGSRVSCLRCSYAPSP
jgi:MFS family permease